MVLFVPVRIVVTAPCCETDALPAATLLNCTPAGAERASAATIGPTAQATIILARRLRRWVHREFAITLTRGCIVFTKTSIKQGYEQGKATVSSLYAIGQIGQSKC